MKRCEKCGLHNPEFINICTNCGNKLDSVKENHIHNENASTENHEKSINIKKNTKKTNYIDFNKQKPDKNKKRNIATGTSLIGGLFYFSGLGLVYLGLIRRFVAELFVGILLFLITNAEISAVYPRLIATITSNNILLSYMDLFGFALVIIITILWWLYTTWDTYRCTYYVNKNKKIPKLLGIIDI